MTAKEMFEKIDYSWKEDNNCIEYTKVYWKHWIWKNKKVICFWKPLQNVEVYEITSGTTELSLEELQAINKQIEELGWNK